MNLRDFLIPAVLAFSTVWLWRTWFSPHQTGVGNHSGKAFIVPDSEIQARPINATIACSTDELLASADPLTVTTNVGTYYVNSATGSIERFTSRVKRVHATQEYQQQYVEECPVRSLDVALADNNVAQFDAHEIHQDESGVTLRFTNEQLGLTKQLRFYQDQHRVDLILQTGPAFEAQLVRLLTPSPTSEFDEYTGVFRTPAEKIDSILDTAFNSKQAWLEPRQFGVATKYFAHLLYADHNAFIQRGFYAQHAQRGLTAFLEGELQPDHTVTLSYYMGPRQKAAVMQVDPSLAGLAGYNGILAPLSNHISSVLNLFAGLTGSVGLAIILLAIIFRIVLLPFTIVSPEAQKKQAEMQRRMTYIQRKYKDDPERLAKERLQVMSTYGTPNGKAFLGLFLELPLIIVFRTLLTNSFEFYHAPFLWLTDLGAPDPYYLLPLLFFCATVVQALVGPSEGRMLKLAFALVGVTIFVYFSSGFLLYLMVMVGLRSLLPPVAERVQRAVYA